MSKRASFWGMIVVFFLTSFLTLHTDVSAAEKADPDLSEKVEQLEKEMNQLSAKNDSYDYLKEETKSYREFVEGEWDRFNNLLQWVLPIVVTVIGATLIFFDVKSIRDIKKRTEEINNTVKKQLDQHVEEELNRETEKMRIRIRDLENIVNRESWLRSSKILVLDRGKLKEIISSSPLNQKNVIYDSPSSHRLPDLLEKGEVDIIVYEYGNDSEKPRDEDLSSLLKILKVHSEQSVSIPIVIYTEGKQVGKTEVQELSKNYPWYTFANNRITLVSNTYGLTHAYYSEAKKA
ncbi:hypothetical protein JOD24_000736 [Kroppenstedtia sanguinis]|uniref:hypothetical protein n=1 Tax=Kroppenstedtia sanguinis TaxID=1380684 RepID=UPI003D25324E